jgi:hypothetical protein
MERYRGEINPRDRVELDIQSPGYVSGLDAARKSSVDIHPLDVLYHVLF